MYLASSLPTMSEGITTLFSSKIKVNLQEVVPIEGSGQKKCVPKSRLPTYLTTNPLSEGTLGIVNTGT